MLQPWLDWQMVPAKLPPWTVLCPVLGTGATCLEPRFAARRSLPAFPTMRAGPEQATRSRLCSCQLPSGTLLKPLFPPLSHLEHSKGTHGHLNGSLTPISHPYNSNFIPWHTGGDFFVFETRTHCVDQAGFQLRHPPVHRLPHARLKACTLDSLHVPTSVTMTHLPIGQPSIYQRTESSFPA